MIAVWFYFIGCLLCIVVTLLDARTLHILGITEVRGGNMSSGFEAILGLALWFLYVPYSLRIIWKRWRLYKYLKSEGDLETFKEAVEAANSTDRQLAETLKDYFSK